MIEVGKSFIEHIFSWPTAVIIISLAALSISILFRHPLTRLILEFASLLHNTKSLSLKSGDTTFETRPDASAQLKEAEKPIETSLGSGSPTTINTVNAADAKVKRKQAFQDFGKAYQSVSFREAAICEELIGVGYQFQTDEVIEVLIRQVATIQMFFAFERAYRLIFGSQLKLLDFLNHKGQQHKSILEIFYNAAVEEYPDFYARTNFDSWTAFLFTNHLMAIEEEEYGISVAGKDFLVWLTIEGLSQNKVF